MGLSFLAPLFFVGMAAIVVPILVHLIQKEKKDAVAFPSLMFLQRIPYQSTRKQKIRHWLLFSLRCLALLLLALAFARPFLSKSGAATATVVSRAREVVILVDRSYSMRYGDRWNRALDAVRREIGSIGPDDRATLVSFGEQATSITERTADQAMLQGAVATLKPSAEGTRYEPALKLAARTLDASELPRREVILISDFQRVGWRGGEAIRLPRGTILRPVDLSDEKTADLAVTNLEARRSTQNGREMVAPSVRVANRSTEPAKSVGVHFELNGRALETKRVDVAANGTATVDFAATPLPEGNSRATVKLDADALPPDDAFHAVLSRGRALPVLLVDNPGAPASASLYVSRALAIGTAPAFKVDTRRSGDVTVNDLNTHPLIILNDAAFPGGDIGRRLADYVRNGGGLLVALGERSLPRNWPASAAALVPIPTATYVDRVEDGGGLLGYLERSHPVFELFRTPRSGDFASARFYRYHPLRAAAGDRQLARFDDGNPALIERTVGTGRVLIWASSLDDIWNDLPVQPVFLPFMHQLVRHAGAVRDRPLWQTVGQALDANDLVSDADVPNAGSATSQLIATAPSGARVVLSASDSGRGRALGLDEQGFYEVRRADAARGTAIPVAVNLDLAESDLGRIEPDQIVRAVTITEAGEGEGIESTTAAEELTPQERERRQTLWWYVLTALVILLGAETLLANRLSRGTKKAGVGRYGPITK
jgi:hypothetical protein